MTIPSEHVQQLSAWLQGADIDLLELKGPAGTLRLTRRGSGPVSEAIDPANVQGHAIVVQAPGVGIFLDRHPLRIQPLAPVGAEVQAGEPIGFLRVGPLVTAIEAPASGVILDVRTEHGAVVGFGTALFDLEPTGSASAP